MFIPALFYIFTPQYRIISIAVLILLFIISRIGLIWEALSIFVKNRIGFLYFIVYLCAVEIAPYFLLYKGALSIMNIVGDTL